MSVRRPVLRRLAVSHIGPALAFGVQLTRHDLQARRLFGMRERHVLQDTRRHVQLAHGPESPRDAPESARQALHLLGGRIREHHGHRLAQATGELVRMALIDGDKLTWVAKAQGARSGLRYDPDMGREVILHATATGKAWLATFDENEALALVKARDFPKASRAGPNVVRTEAALRQQLRETRQRGYGLALEEAEAGTAAIACTSAAPGMARRPSRSHWTAAPAMNTDPSRA